MTQDEEFFVAITSILGRAHLVLSNEKYQYLAGKVIQISMESLLGASIPEGQPIVFIKLPNGETVVDSTLN